MSEDKAKILDFGAGHRLPHEPWVDPEGLEQKIADQRRRYETIMQEFKAFLPEVVEVTEKLENLNKGAYIDEGAWKAIWVKLNERRGGLEIVLQNAIREEGSSPDIISLQDTMRRYADALKLPEGSLITFSNDYKKCLAFLCNLEIAFKRAMTP